MRKLTALLATLFLHAGLVSSAVAGDDDRSTSNLMSGGVTIPYEGFLMLDNAAMTGTHVLRFDLWDDASASAAANLRYSETQTVTLYNGLFSAAIGTGTQIGARTLDEAVLDGDRLYVAIAIEDGAGTFVALAGRQAIEAVPYSAWSQNSADMSVAGDLSVGGAITTGSVDVNGNVTATGGVTAGSLTVNSGIDTGRFSATANFNRMGTVRFDLINNLSIIDSGFGTGPLMLRGSSSDARVLVEDNTEIQSSLRVSNDVVVGQDVRVSNDVVVGQDVRVSNNVGVTGDIIAPSNVRGDCTWTTTRRLSHGTTNTRFCPDGKFQAGINFANPSNQVNQITYEIYCCEL